jgi:hypothetical protein
MSLSNDTFASYVILFWRSSHSDVEPGCSWAAANAWAQIARGAVPVELALP